MRTLSLKTLNRTTLARQLLWARQPLSATEAVSHLVAMQSQIPNPPYIGLWSRLAGFVRDDLTQAMQRGEVVRVAMHRSTLQLMTAHDYQVFWCVVKPALEKGLRSFFGKRLGALDFDRLIEAAQAFIEESPRAMGELRAFLLKVMPEGDPAAMSYLIRTFIPLVQVFPAGTWGKGSSASYALATQRLGAMSEEASPLALFKRYLKAFGPASVMDFQTWAGMTKIQAEIDPFREEFVLYRDENGRELFDLPEMSLAEEAMPVPVRFLPEYDNILIAHADRRRVIADEHRAKVFLTAGRILGTCWVDGFVAGTWKAERQRKDAVLTVSLFEDVPSATQEAIVAEAEALLAFIEPNATLKQVVLA